MTQTELFKIAKGLGWRESLCDLSRGQIVLRAQNDCIVILRRVRPGQGCRDIFERNRLKQESLDHQISFKFLRCGKKPHIIGPFGAKGFNLITNRFESWDEVPEVAA